jgi:hypothetical protein
MKSWGLKFIKIPVLEGALELIWPKKSKEGLLCACRRWGRDDIGDIQSSQDRKEDRKLNFDLPRICSRY